MRAKEFKFISHSFDEKKMTAYLKYAVNSIVFQEKIIFNSKKQKINIKNIKVIKKLLPFLHIAAGISYYKAFIPGNISLNRDFMTEENINFFNKFYFNGLGEFAFKNKVDLRFLKSIFKTCKKIKKTDTKQFINDDETVLKHRIGLPLGGGKDSIVALELAKKKGDSVLGISIGPFKEAENICKIAGIPYISITRKISPNLIKLNQQGVYNGHVPIVGIYSFILLIAAFVYDFDTILIANEKSSSVGNVKYLGENINHQWSKSLEFENLFRSFISSQIKSNINYFSILRPLSDVQITKYFSNFEKYHNIFVSCNVNYRLGRKNISTWCGDCAKCRFTFLMLAPFLEKKKLIKIFGNRNLLNESKQIREFKRLVGLGDNKPFDCVGEFKESVKVFKVLSEDKNWKEDYVVKNISKKFNKKIATSVISQKEDVSKKNWLNIPNEFKKIIKKEIAD